MTAYYNEIDPFKAEVLRVAISAGAIAPGDVDERSIADVDPAELVGYTQCHFFAGGGFWSLALRSAGWPDDRPVWTGSCPCPSFSAAGKGAGFADPRHLWPQWHTLIRECRPASLFGEQVAAAIGHGWLDLVCGDLEAEGYAIAAAVLGAHSVGAPHIRQRLYFCADADSGSRIGGQSQSEQRASAPRRRRWMRHDGRSAQRAGIAGESGECGDAQDHGLLRGAIIGWKIQANEQSGNVDLPSAIERSSLPIDGSGHAARGGFGVAGSAPGTAGHATQPDGLVGGADTASLRRQSEPVQPRNCIEGDESPERGPEPGTGCFSGGEQPQRAGLEGHFGDVREWRGPGWLDPLAARSVAEAGATRGYWANCDWWYGRDEKYRPIGLGLFPLAHGGAARVGRLRMYGDAICVPLAQAFIEAYLETKAPE